MRLFLRLQQPVQLSHCVLEGLSQARLSVEGQTQVLVGKEVSQ